MENYENETPGVETDPEETVQIPVDNNYEEEPMTAEIPAEPMAAEPQQGAAKDSPFADSP